MTIAVDLGRKATKTNKNKRGSSKYAHAWISIIFCMLNTYVITTIKMKLFYSSKAVGPRGGGGAP